MGPLYHLLEREERLRAIENCLARLKKRGKLYAAFISIYSDMIYRIGRLDSWPEGILSIGGTEAERKYYAALRSGGEYAGDAFTRAYFTNPEQILRHFEAFRSESCTCWAARACSPQGRAGSRSARNSVRPGCSSHWTSANFRSS